MSPAKSGYMLLDSTSPIYRALFFRRAIYCLSDVAMVYEICKATSTRRGRLLATSSKHQCPLTNCNGGDGEACW